MIKVMNFFLTNDLEMWNLATLQTSRQIQAENILAPKNIHSSWMQWIAEILEDF